MYSRPIRRFIQGWVRHSFFRVSGLVGISLTLAVGIQLWHVPTTADEAIALTEPTAFAADSPHNMPNPTQLDTAAVWLPSGYQPQWKSRSLDSMSIQVLAQPFRLSETYNRVGSEYYTYTSFLLDQVASHLPEETLKTQLQNLSTQADSMGNKIRQASDLRYEGAPSGEMAHLQTRANIQFYLQGLNPHPLIQTAYNENGQKLSEVGPAPSDQAGETVSEFKKTLQAILQNPESKRYPQTMQFIQQHAEQLSQLASHMTLRWESRFYCGPQRQADCGHGVATAIRIYTEQTLPESKLAFN